MYMYVQFLSVLSSCSTFTFSNKELTGSIFSLIWYMYFLIYGKWGEVSGAYNIAYNINKELRSCNIALSLMWYSVHKHKIFWALKRSLCSETTLDKKFNTVCTKALAFEQSPILVTNSCCYKSEIQVWRYRYLIFVGKIRFCLSDILVVAVRYSENLRRTTLWSITNGWYVCTCMWCVNGSNRHKIWGEGSG